MTTKQTVTGWAALRALEEGKTLYHPAWKEHYRFNFEQGVIQELWRGEIDDPESWCECEMSLSHFFGYEFEVMP